MYTFADWYKTPWDKIDVDVLVEETKKMAKDVKTLNKAVSTCIEKLSLDISGLIESCALLWMPDMLYLSTGCPTFCCAGSQL